MSRSDWLSHPFKFHEVVLYFFLGVALTIGVQQLYRFGGDVPPSARKTDRSKDERMASLNPEKPKTAVEPQTAEKIDSPEEIKAADKFKLLKKPAQIKKKIGTPKKITGRIKPESEPESPESKERLQATIEKPDPNRIYVDNVWALGFVTEALERCGRFNRGVRMKALETKSNEELKKLKPRKWSVLKISGHLNFRQSYVANPKSACDQAYILFGPTGLREQGVLDAQARAQPQTQIQPRLRVEPQSLPQPKVHENPLPPGEPKAQAKPRVLTAPGVPEKQRPLTAPNDTR